MTATTSSLPTGVLLINLGTPDAPDTQSVRTYLREFLNDPRVIDINPVGRALLLNLIILPFRPAKSAEAYAKVWTEAGSPLLVHGRDLQNKLAKELGTEWIVELGMRYGNPSIESALMRLLQQDIARVVVVPLFPQYSSAASGSALQKTQELMSQLNNVPPVTTLDAFYEDPAFTSAFVDVAKAELETFKPDHVLFSYHGLPERHMRNSDTTGAHCLVKDNCCAEIGPANRYCYRAQCFATTRALAEGLNLAADAHSVAFQSRLGRDPWIKPYTDLVLPELARKGVKRLAVMCPAFVADCLETLEEIGLRAKEQWKEEGGEDLILIPSLNAHPSWVTGLAQMVRAA